MPNVDIEADLNAEDHTGFVWTFLDEARDPSLIVPGAIVTAGDGDVVAPVEVVDLVDHPNGTIVHLRLLPGPLANYAAALRGPGTLSASGAVPVIDLPADLNAEDESGAGWALLSGATDPSCVRVGAVLIAGTPTFWTRVRVTAIDDDGQIHFRQLHDPDETQT